MGASFFNESWNWSGFKEPQSKPLDMEPTMKLKRTVLGKTGLEVSRMGMGAAFMSRWGGGSLDQYRATVQHGIKLGVNYFDTAAGYADSEENLGKTLEGVKTPVIISTKLGGRPQPFDARNKDHLYRSFEESLKLLKRDKVEMLFIHEAERPGQYNWWTEGFYEGALRGPVLDVLDDLKRQKLIQFTGMGGTTVYELARLCETGVFDVVLTTFNYSLLWREAEHGVIPVAQKMKMGIITGSPLQQGGLVKRFDDEVNHGSPWLSPPRRAQYKALYALLDDLKMPIVELAMRFVISNPAIHCVLTGSKSVAELDQNAGAVLKGPLPSDVLTRINEISAMVPFRPFCEPFSLPFGRAYSGPGPA
jgi:aryl-alcohol dehydrogenase-like predicted oxidoreductase